MSTIEDYQRVADEAIEREKATQKKLDDLIAALARDGDAPAGDPEAAAAAKRAEKVAKMELSMRKSVKVKDFKEGQEHITVKEWLSKFDE